MKGKKTGGRKIGSENKVTKDIKEAYRMLIEANIPNLTEWLERVAETNPNEALKYLSSLSEFVVPKLGRTEVTGNVDTTVTVIFTDAS
jgi:hypothetical protein